MLMMMTMNEKQKEEREERCSADIYIKKKQQHFHEKQLFPKYIKHLKNKSLYRLAAENLQQFQQFKERSKNEVHEYRIIQVCVRLVKCCYCSSACVR